MAAICTILEEHKWSESDWEEMQCLLVEVDMDTSYVRPGTAHMLEPSALVSKKGIDPDMPNLSQALTSDHASEWKEAMEKEIEAIVKRRAWKIVPIEKVLSPKEKRWQANGYFFNMDLQA